MEPRVQGCDGAQGAGSSAAVQGRRYRGSDTQGERYTGGAIHRGSGAQGERCTGGAVQGEGLCVDR